jgi:hypothetical protein
LSIQAQEEDKEVKQADVQSPKKVGTKADEIPVTLYGDRIAQDSSCSFDVMRARDSGEPMQENVKMTLLRKKNEEF